MSFCVPAAYTWIIAALSYSRAGRRVNLHITQSSCSFAFMFRTKNSKLFPQINTFWKYQHVYDHSWSLAFNREIWDMWEWVKLPLIDIPLVMATLLADSSSCRMYFFQYQRTKCILPFVLFICFPLKEPDARFSKKFVMLKHKQATRLMAPHT